MSARKAQFLITTYVHPYEVLSALYTSPDQICNKAVCLVIALLFLLLIHQVQLKGLLATNQFTLIIISKFDFGFNFYVVFLSSENVRVAHVCFMF